MPFFSCASDRKKVLTRSMVICIHLIIMKNIQDCLDNPDLTVLRFSCLVSLGPSSGVSVREINFRFPQGLPYSEDKYAGMIFGGCLIIEKLLVLM